MEIRPLCDAVGAEVTGVDLSRPLDDDTTRQLHEAFLEYHLLCFRGDPLTAEEFAQTSRIFGETQLQLIRDKRHGEAPEVSILNSTYKTPDDKPDDLRLMRLTGWHTDDSYFAEPAKATLLQSIEIPETGGQTSFCNMEKAYDDWPEDRKRRADGLRAVHSYDTMRTPARAVKRRKVEAEETPDVVHPLIRTHDDTGRRTIYVNTNRTDRIVDMDRAESDALLDEIYEHVTRPDYIYRHEWRVGDLLIWDNRCLMHSVNMDFPVGQTRLHQRILLKGPAPV